jgi:hypothetical protein
MAINWLEWEAKNTEQHIRHQGNDSEKLIGMKRLPVLGRSYEGLIFLVVTMKHDARAPNDVVLV